MATAPLPDISTAQDVARGVARWLWSAAIVPLFEVPLGNGRRADVVGLGPDGRLTLVEVKVALGDLHGDQKWPEYLDYCDRYYWAVPPDFRRDDLDDAGFRPDICGLLIADRWGGSELRAAVWRPLSPARRKAETLRFARRAAQRLLWLADPGAGEAARIP